MPPEAPKDASHLREDQNYLLGYSNATQAHINDLRQSLESSQLLALKLATLLEKEGTDILGSPSG